MTFYTLFSYQQKPHRVRVINIAFSVVYPNVTCLCISLHDAQLSKIFSEPSLVLPSKVLA